MSRTIAVWGAPHSGKTTFACRLGGAIASSPGNHEDGYAVIVVGASPEVPALPQLFPHRKPEELRSFGDLLARPDRTEEQILETLVTGKENGNLAFLGYAQHEHRTSYPVPSARSVRALWDMLTDLADALIVDVPSVPSDPFSAFALSHADTVFRLLVPDVSTAVWESSRREEFGREERTSEPGGVRWREQIPLSANPEGRKGLPAQDFRLAVTEFRFAVPYRNEWKTALEEGKLPFLPVTKKERSFLLSLLPKEAAFG